MNLNNFYNIFFLRRQCSATKDVLRFVYFHSLKRMLGLVDKVLGVKIQILTKMGVRRSNNNDFFLLFIVS